MTCYLPEPASERVVSLAGTVEAIGPAVDEALDTLDALRCPARVRDAVAAAEERDILRLALTEALNNVVEHAGHPSDRPVLVRVAETAAGPSFLVEDHGRPLPVGLADGVPPAVAPAPGAAVATLPEGGWGWMLIHASVERVAYERQGSVNRLRLTGCRRMGDAAA